MRVALLICGLLPSILFVYYVYAVVSIVLDNGRTILRQIDNSNEMRRLFDVKTQIERSGWDSSSGGGFRSNPTDIKLASSRFQKNIGNLEDVGPRPIDDSCLAKDIFDLAIIEKSMISPSKMAIYGIASKDQSEKTVRSENREIFIDAVDVERRAAQITKIINGKEYSLYIYIDRLDVEELAARIKNSIVPKALHLTGVNMQNCKCTVLGEFQYDNNSAQRNQYIKIVVKGKPFLMRMKHLYAFGGKPHYSGIYLISIFDKDKLVLQYLFTLNV